VMAGESLLSHLSGYLMFATTAMVASLLDRGVAVGPGLFSDPPLVVLRQLNRDLGIARRFRMDDARNLTALDIQWRLLEDVAGHYSMLPGWAPRAVELWAATLSELEAPSESAAPRLDWTIYQSALCRLAVEFGVDPDAMSLHGHPQSARRKTNGRSGPKSALAELRAAACELHLRLRILGEGSLFEQLEHSGAIRHRLPEVDGKKIRRMEHAAPPGRARRRARFIRKHGRCGIESREGEEDLRVSWDEYSDGDRIRSMGGVS